MNSIAALFPGQGSQHVGMAKDLYLEFRKAREVFEEASDSIHLDLKKLCFEGPESDLTLTENTQPCLLTASVAAFRCAEDLIGIQPQAVAGHSLGEYSALVATGALKLSTAVQWVRERGLAMQRAVPAGEGGMMAILGLEDEKIRLLCDQATIAAQEKRRSTQGQAEKEYQVPAAVEPANFNAPGQTVIAGSADALEAAALLAKAGGNAFAGAKAIPLQVSAPFHCPLMKPATEAMKKVFEQTKSPWGALKCPYIPNRTARLTREPGVVLDLLIEQIENPVLWRQSMTTLLEGGFTHFVEFGPGKVLSGLMKRIAAGASKNCTQIQVNDTGTLKNLESVYAQTK